MAIAGEFDIHRRRSPSTMSIARPVRSGAAGSPRRARSALRDWLEQFAGRADVTFAVEGCTGWRFVVEEFQSAGITALLTEPAQTAYQRARRSGPRPARPMPGCCGTWSPTARCSDQSALVA